MKKSTWIIKEEAEGSFYIWASDMKWILQSMACICTSLSACFSSGIRVANISVNKVKSLSLYLHNPENANTLRIFESNYLMFLVFYWCIHHGDLCTLNLYDLSPCVVTPCCLLPWWTFLAWACHGDMLGSGTALH